MDSEEIESKLYTSEEVDEIKAELNDKYLRIFAEFDNYKKRMQKEKEDIRISTKTNMLSSILDIDSDLSIALKNINDPGISLIISKINNFLKSQGVESIQTDKYDPELHEVISVLETGDERVIDVVSKGYSINGKPFRFPKVVISKWI